MPRMLKRLMLAAVLIASIAGFVALRRRLAIHIPAYRAPGELIVLEQGWTPSQRLEFHHVAQGTRLLPYRWLLALEQPCLSLSACEPFTAPTYLERFGFLPSQAHTEWNPDQLPIGFTRQIDFFDPESGKRSSVAGLTCAACHTGQLRYGNYEVRIEGAPAMIEVAEFQKALGIALTLTRWAPLRYGRFERKVLGPGATEERKNELRTEFSHFLEAANHIVSVTETRRIYPHRAGFGRTDALTRIGNQVFAVDMKIDDNFAPSNAPVRYPQIWDAPWLNWVQYNSSIADPLVRNIGQALGVRAVAKLWGDDAAEYSNSVRIEGLRRVEDLIAGDAPYRGLTSPKWPAVFPALDSAKVARGAELYRAHCQRCHLPPVSELQSDLASPQPRHWSENEYGKRFLRVTDVPLEFVGTDPRQAEDFFARTADSGALKKGRISAAEGLDVVTSGIRDRFFTRAGLSAEQRTQWSGYRNPASRGVRALKVYKARPLNGIWAVAPYLHNGSVPNLFLLLSPASDRPAAFWTGSRDYDAKYSGFSYTEFEGGYLYDTALPGNGNRGHEFKDGPLGNGVVGPALAVEDRWAVIEFLKSQ